MQDWPPFATFRDLHRVYSLGLRVFQHSYSCCNKFSHFCLTATFWTNLFQWQSYYYYDDDYDYCYYYYDDDYYYY